LIVRRRSIRFAKRPPSEDGGRGDRVGRAAAELGPLHQRLLELLKRSARLFPSRPPAAPISWIG
jgi:hypothetical protein